MLEKPSKGLTYSLAKAFSWRQELLFYGYWQPKKREETRDVFILFFSVKLKIATPNEGVRKNVDVMSHTDLKKQNIFYITDTSGTQDTCHV